MIITLFAKLLRNHGHLVSSSKVLIKKLKDDGWDALLTTMKSFLRGTQYKK